MDPIAQLESRIGRTLPAGYREWSRKGYTDVRQLDTVYLWVFEAEWIPLDQIPGYDLWRSNIIPGLIPFAFSGAGDHWCWNGQVRNGEGEYEVLYCWHDEEHADAYAPSFPAWFYRTCLDYAANWSDPTGIAVQEGQANFRLWAERLSEIYTGPWIDHLLSLAEVIPFEYTDPKLRAGVKSLGFITTMEVEKIIAEQFGDRYLDEKVAWGEWPC
jgi:hypothetical protein